MTSDNIAEYVGENNQFTEKPVTEYPPVIQDNTVTTKDYLYSNNIDTDLLVVIGGLIVILFLMMLIMYAYFHERRSLNNFHRDRVITFEQIAE